MSRIAFDLYLDRIAAYLKKHEETIERRVWAYSNKFHLRMVMIATIEVYLLDGCIRNACDDKAKNEAKHLQYEFEHLLKSFIMIDETGPYRKGHKRPSMVEHQKTWLNLIDQLRDYVSNNAQI